MSLGAKSVLEEVGGEGGGRGEGGGGGGGGGDFECESEQMDCLCMISVRLVALIKESVRTPSRFGVVVYRKGSSSNKMMFDRIHVCARCG